MSPIEARWFVGHGGRPVFYRRIVPDNPRGGVIVVHGYSEHSGRYVHVMQALADRGYAVFAEDHRGHGRTARVLGDVESVEAILGDLGVLHRTLVQTVPGKPVFFLGHSMGALLTLKYLLRHGDTVAGAVLNGAALQVPANIPGAAKIAARLLARVAPRVAIQGFFDPTRASRDPAVWAQMRADPLRYKGKIRARTGAEMLIAMRTALDALGQIRLPVLITHGTHDETVKAAVSHRLHAAVRSEDRTLHLFEGLRHEVQHEPEQGEVIALWADWIEARTR